MKKFWKKTEGFTLVELIVVIAILGILAGVGTVGYSGYIKKANETADKQLLSSASTAITVACIENTVSPMDLAGAVIELNADGTIKTPDAPLDLSATKAYQSFPATYARGASPAEDFEAKINVSFLEGFGSCENVKFKVCTTVKFNGTSFAGYESVTYDYKGTQITVSAADIEAYQKSNWGTLPSADILTLVGSVTDLATAIDNDTFAAMMESPEYAAAAAAALGVSLEEYGTVFGGLLDAELAKYQEAHPDATAEELDQKRNELGAWYTANNAVLVAAKGAQTTGSGIISLLTEEGGKNAKESIKLTMSTDPSTGLSQAALAYGLYSSYMLEKDPDNFDADAPMDFTVVLNTMTDDGFQKYLTEGNGKQDLDGYLAALNAVSDNTGNGGIGTDILANGFNNEDLATLLKQAMGK